MRIAVLDLSYWPPEFGEVLADWLAQGLPEADLPVIDVIEGAPLPQIADYDGYVLSGSADGVYDDAPYIAALRDFLVAARAADKPLLGICFGHQLMADVFGGKAEKVGEPEVGVRDYDLEGTSVPAHVWHKDQVTKKPPNARVIASAPYCPIGALEYDFPALSVQFHPEYTRGYFGGFLDRGRGELLPHDHTDQVLDQLSADRVKPDLFAVRAGNFFRAALSP